MQALDCPSFFSPVVGSVPMAGIFFAIPLPPAWGVRGGGLKGACPYPPVVGVFKKKSGII